MEITYTAFPGIRCGGLCPLPEPLFAAHALQAGRLSGLYDGGRELDELSRTALTFHPTRHESPLLHLERVAAELRRQRDERQQQQEQGCAKEQQQQQQQMAGSHTAGCCGTQGCVRSCGSSRGSPAPPAESSGVQQEVQKQVQVQPQPQPQPQGSSDWHRASSSTARCCCCCCSPTSSSSLSHADAQQQAHAQGRTSGLILGAPQDSSCGVSGLGGPAGAGVAGGLDLGHLSCLCVSAAPLADDFLGELLRQTCVCEEEEERRQQEQQEEGMQQGKQQQQQQGHSHRLQLLPGVFFSYFIGSQAFTNTAVRGHPGPGRKGKKSCSASCKGALCIWECDPIALRASQGT